MKARLLFIACLLYCSSLIGQSTNYGCLKVSISTTKTTFSIEDYRKVMLLFCFKNTCDKTLKESELSFGYKGWEDADFYVELYTKENGIKREVSNLTKADVGHSPYGFSLKKNQIDTFRFQLMPYLPIEKKGDYFLTGVYKLKEGGKKKIIKTDEIKLTIQ